MKNDYKINEDEIRDIIDIEVEDDTDKESHILKCHEDLCVADDSNLNRFRTVLDMLGSEMVSPPEDKPDQVQ